MVIVHVCTMIILYAYTMIILHACTMIIVHVSCGASLMFIEIKDAGSGRRISSGKQGPNGVCRQKKMMFFCFLTILKSSSNALDGLPGSDWGRVVEAKLNNSY